MNRAIDTRSFHLPNPPPENGPVHRYGAHAMAARFEIFIADTPAQDAVAAAEAAFEELAPLEEELSRFVDFSDVSRINALEPGESLRVGIATLDCIRLGLELCRTTGGAFDPTALSGGPRMSALERLSIDEATFSITVKAEEVTVDLGGIGKGYAIDRLAERLADWGITAALIHAGESSLLALDPPAGADGWSVAIRDPLSQTGTLDRLTLCQEAISGSGIGLQGEHIVDPRTGQPVTARLGSWARAKSAALSDGLSTAFMVMSAEEIRRYTATHPAVAGLIAEEREGKPALTRF